MYIITASCLRAAAEPLPWSFEPHVAGYKYKISNIRQKRDTVRRTAPLTPRPPLHPLPNQNREDMNKGRAKETDGGEYW